MDPLLVLVALWLLYGVALGVSRLLGALRRRPAPEGAPRRPPVGTRPPAPPRAAPRRPPVRETWSAPEETARPPRAEPPTPAPARAPAADWRRRLARPEKLREAIVAAEILRRPGRAMRSAR